MADAEQGLVGSIGRITVSIPAGRPGEVMLSVRGGTEAFAALSDEPIPRHSRVVAVPGPAASPELNGELDGAPARQTG